MGNVQSGSTLTRTTGALDSFVSELGGDIEYERSLGSARFLKTVKCKHRNGYLVVKIFIKPDPGVTLRTHLRRLKGKFFEVDSEQPLRPDQHTTFLEYHRKEVDYLPSSNRPAGRAKPQDLPWRHQSENILVTSWNWVYLSDFAPYKPVYLPLDDPSDFSFFFDTSGRRTCYIAPERFYTASSNPEISAKKSKMALENEGKRDGRITEAMDCFSVGCVIAELFLEGAPLFTLAQLFKYREGDYNPDTHLNAIEDEGVQVIFILSFLLAFTERVQ
ncbi:hypothetical protein MPER_08411 [Moniliophthora perniciosa FA553]|nr:hypothetical protein MPER_08411 [Moniliophthora perniciosa FA553]